MISGQYKYDESGSDLMPNEVYKNQSDYAKALLYGAGQQPVKHWLQGVSNMVAALMGGRGLYNAGQGLTRSDLTSANTAAGALDPNSGAPPENPTEAASVGAAEPNTPVNAASASALPPPAAQTEPVGISADPMQVAQVLSPQAAAKPASKSLPPPAFPRPGSQPIIDPALLPRRGEVSRAAMARMIADKRIDPAVRQAIMEKFLSQGMPGQTTINTPYGPAPLIYDRRNPANQRLDAPFVRDKIKGPGGTEVTDEPVQAIPDGKGGWIKVRPFGAATPPSGGGSTPDTGPPELTPPPAPKPPIQNALPAGGEGPGGLAEAASATEPFINPRAPTDAVTPPAPAPEPEVAPPIQTAQAGGPTIDPEVAAKMKWLEDQDVNYNNRKELGKKQIDEYVKTTDSIQKAAQSANAEVPNLELLKKIAANPRFPSGTFSGTRIEFDRLLHTLGLSKGEIASLGDSFEKLRSGAVLKNMKTALEGLGQVRLAEIDLLNRAMASKTNTPAANKVILDLAIKTAQEADMVSRITEGYDKGYRIGKDGQWMKGPDGKPARVGGTPTNTELRANINNWARNNPMMTPEQQQIMLDSIAASEAAQPEIATGKKGKSFFALPPPPPSKDQLIEDIKRLRGG